MDCRRGTQKCAASVLAVLISLSDASILPAQALVPGATKSAIASVEPRRISFGKVREGIPKTSRFVHFINKSKSPLAAPVAAVSGAGFGIATNDCASAIPSGGSCRVSVFFLPEEVGNAAGTLTFTDAGLSNALTVKLKAKGLKGVTPTSTATSTATPTPTASGDADGDGNCDGDGVGDCNGVGNCDCDGHCNVDDDADGVCDGDEHCYCHGNVDAYFDGDSQFD